MCFSVFGVGKELAGAPTGDHGVHGHVGARAGNGVLGGAVGALAGLEFTAGAESCDAVIVGEAAATGELSGVCVMVTGGELGGCATVRGGEVVGHGWDRCERGRRGTTGRGS